MNREMFETKPVPIAQWTKCTIEVRNVDLVSETECEKIGAKLTNETTIKRENTHTMRHTHKLGEKAD